MMMLGNPCATPAPNWYLLLTLQICTIHFQIGCIIQWTLKPKCGAWQAFLCHPDVTLHWIRPHYFIIFCYGPFSSLWSLLRRKSLSPSVMWTFWQYTSVSPNMHLILVAQMKEYVNLWKPNARMGASPVPIVPSTSEHPTLSPSQSLRSSKRRTTDPRNQLHISGRHRSSVPDFENPPWSSLPLSCFLLRLLHRPLLLLYVTMFWRSTDCRWVILFCDSYCRGVKILVHGHFPSFSSTASFVYTTISMF